MPQGRGPVHRDDRGLPTGLVARLEADGHNGGERAACDQIARVPGQDLLNGGPVEPRLVHYRGGGADEVFATPFGQRRVGGRFCIALLLALGDEREGGGAAQFHPLFEGERVWLLRAGGKRGGQRKNGDEEAGGEHRGGVSVGMMNASPRAVDSARSDPQAIGREDGE